ncbi:hypothetical protein, partial [Bacteroides sp.]|uniref:hypothetical protein n=1 Tax=Bacteroides sp. TaxID=29523 RepID=UPI003AB7A0AE
FYHSLHFTFAFGLYKGHYTYPMVAQFSTGILAQFSISIYRDMYMNILSVTLQPMPGKRLESSIRLTRWLS